MNERYAGGEDRRGRSNVTVYFLDGSQHVFPITAHHTVGGSLIEKAGKTGVLNLYNDQKSWGIPLETIKFYEIEATEDPRAAN